MKAIETSKKVHMFVCCRQREDKPSCGAKGAEKWLQNIKAWVASEGLKDGIQISKSSCLGHCEQGIAVCIYPQNKRFIDVTVDDTEALQQELLDALKPTGSPEDI